MRAAVLEQVQMEASRQVFADPHAALGIADLVEPRREHADAEMARQHRGDAAADAALGGQPDLELPAAGIVVHAAGVHDAEHRADMLGWDRALAGERIDAAIPERRAHQCQIARCHQHRTLPEVDFKHFVDAALDDPVVVQQVGDGAVAVAGQAFGAMHRLVHVEVAADEAAEAVEHALEALLFVAALDQRGRGDRPGIDHGVEWPVVALVEGDGVEGFARGFDADLAQHLLATVVGQRHAVDDGLRDRLDGEQRGTVAGLVDIAVHGGERDAEQVVIDPRQLGDIARHRSLAVLLVPLMQLIEIVADRQGRCVHGISCSLLKK